MSEMNATGAGEAGGAGMSGMAAGGATATRSSGSGQRSGQGSSTGRTGTSDLDYNLVSILYHALQGAETYDQYIQDAQQDGDQDLAGFFREVQQENKRRADRAKQLLARRIGR